MKGRTKIMGEKTFMTAGTEVDGYIEKIDLCLDKISNILAEACVSRAKKGRVSNELDRYINNIIKHLPLEEQVVILRKLAVVLTSQITGGSKDKSTKSSKTHVNDMFANRMRY